jgi:hypothetical protein
MKTERRKSGDYISAYDMQRIEARLGKWLWLLVVVNALCVLCFRCFITLDGPMHVLHSAVLMDALGERSYSAAGLQYDLNAIDVGLLDPIAMLLLTVLSPELVEAALAAIALLVFGLGALAYVRAYAGAVPLHAAWVLPFSFSIILLLGFLPFVFAVGLCFWFAARWVKFQTVTWRTLPWAVTALWLCMVTHRGALLMLTLLLGAHEMLLFLNDRVAFRSRWSVLPRWLVFVLIGCSVSGVATAAVWMFFFSPVFEPVGSRTPLTDLLRLRSLSLLDQHSELGYLIGMAVLMFGSLVLAVRGCLHKRTPWVQHAPLLAGSLLILGSLLIHTPWAYLHYFPERAQFVGLLLLMLWCALHVRGSKLSVVAVIGIIALHTVRTVYIERRMAHYTDERAAVVEVAQHLAPGTLVATFQCSTDWLLQHQFAYLSIRHQGIVLSKRDKIWIERTNIAAKALGKAIKRKPEDPAWLLRCADDPECPVTDRVVVLCNARGGDAEATTDLSAELQGRYAMIFESEYAVLWRREH